MFTVEIETSALKVLSRIDLADRRRISERIRELAEDPRPSGVVKLTGVDGWRLRVGNYRIVYVIDDVAAIVTVTRIGHRREVYRGL